MRFLHSVSRTVDVHTLLSIKTCGSFTGYPEQFTIVLTGRDTQLKALIGQLLSGSAVSKVTDDGLKVTESGAFKVITVPDFGIHLSLHVTDCMALSQPGPHLFILAVQADQADQAREEINALRKCFGKDIIRHLVVMVNDMGGYQELRPLEEELGFRLATANENMQRQCREWCSGPAYNYENNMSLLLEDRKKTLEAELHR